MRAFPLPHLLLLAGLAAQAAAAADTGNRLTYLDRPADPYYVGLDTPKLTTPQWVGRAGVRAVIVLAIDDMGDAARYEAFLRPILQRLKRIGGRAPLSIMTTRVDPKLPQLQQWLGEGLSIEVHTTEHPCPCLQKGDLKAAKATYDRCVDLLATIPNNRPVAFRMPCCDSMNSVSPRFFTEIFNRRTPAGRFLAIDSSVFHIFSPDDPSLPRSLVVDRDGRSRMAKYIPSDRPMVNYIRDYPYPYVIGRLCWEVPCLMPSDWEAQHLSGKCNPRTLDDWKAAVDATVLKEGMFALCFHPHGWIDNRQVVALIDYAVSRYGRQVEFLNLHDVAARLNRHLLNGHPLRAADGGDNGVRICDVNHDGLMDVIIANGQLRQTRIWDPGENRWRDEAFPFPLVRSMPDGSRRESGARFGVLQPSGQASVLVRSEQAEGLWHYRRGTWQPDPHGLEGLADDRTIATARQGRDEGVRLIDLDLDGRCELIVGNPREQAVFRFGPSGWKRLAWHLPDGVTLVDREGRDAGLRLIDFDEDGYRDIIFSNPRKSVAYLFSPPSGGWTRKVCDARPGSEHALPSIVRADGSNNGVWVKDRHVWVQNEETGGTMPHHVGRWSFTHDLLAAEKQPPPRDPAAGLRSLIPRSGFRVALAACEPMVMDPIDLAWGPDGKLWVVEMADYPMGVDGRGKAGGRVRFLEDTDGDGRYDTSTVFLEPVPFPTSVMPWRQGVLVAAAPTVFYAEDRDGDGRADFRETILDGFHEGNQQHRVNHLRWGLDNWIYAANGDSDGRIRSIKTGKVVDISGRDVRFRPDDGALDTASGRTQFGRNRDDWGNWFGCNNNNPGWSYALVDHYTRRNPHVAAPAGRIDLTQQRDVYPAGRVMTHCFYDQPTPPEGVPGRWTSVAGAMIYRDELFGPALAGNFFVADAVYNVVHRMVLSYDGLRIDGRRAVDEQQSEFLASADPWFRPTTVRLGPDGALWVTDMYRQVIEHPQWIDDRLEKTLDLRRGCDRGRIYRIVPVGIQPRPMPRLDRLGTGPLVQALDSPNGWQRDMVQQMLVWRADRAAVAPLEALVQNSARPQTRLQALCTLDGLGALRAEILLDALADPHPAVRRHAVRLSEPLLGREPQVARAVLQRGGDADATVLRQLAFSLGEWNAPEAGALLADLAARSEEDPLMMAAVISSAVPHVETMLRRLRETGKHAALVARLEKLAEDVAEHPDAQTELTTAERSARLPGKSGPLALPTSRERQAVLDRFSPVVTMQGDPVHGKQLFVEATCSNCHQLDGVGQQIGPDIRTLVDRSPENLLVAILDPNRAVKERFVEYLVMTLDGRTFSGMLLEQTSNSLTLATVKGEKKTILLRDVEQSIPTNRSFMSEGLEANLSLQDMADLLAFLQKAGVPRRRFPGNAPATQLVGQDGTLDLPVARAEIYGPEIAFDAERGCVTHWTRAEAYLAWTVHLHSPRTYDVWIEAASPPEAAGGAFRIEAEAQSVAAAVPATAGADDFRWTKVGTLRLSAGGHRIGFRSAGAIDRPLLVLKTVRMVPPGRMPVAVAKKLEAVDPASAIQPEPDGAIRLRAARGKAIGPRIRYQPEFQSFGWFTAADRVEWIFRVDRPGYYEAWLEWSVDDASAGKPWHLSIEGQRLDGVAARTGSWETYRKIRIGRVELAAGYQKAVFRPGAAFDGPLLDLREITLVPIDGPPPAAAP